MGKNMSVETFMRKVVLNIIHPICMLFSRGRPPLSHCYAQLSLAETTICLPAFIYDYHSFTTPILWEFIMQILYKALCLSHATATPNKRDACAS